MGEEVVGDDGVSGSLVGYSGTVSTEARKGDFDGLIGREFLISRGSHGEVVDAEEGTKVLDLEELLEGVKGSGVG